MPCYDNEFEMESGLHPEVEKEVLEDFVNFMKEDENPIGSNDSQKEPEEYYDDFAMMVMNEGEDDESIINMMYCITKHYGNCFAAWYDERTADSVECAEYEEWCVKQEIEETKIHIEKAKKSLENLEIGLVTKKKRKFNVKRK